MTVEHTEGSKQCAVVKIRSRLIPKSKVPARERGVEQLECMAACRVALVYIAFLSLPSISLDNWQLSEEIKTDTLGCQAALTAQESHTHTRLHPRLASQSTSKSISWLPSQVLQYERRDRVPPS